MLKHLEWLLEGWDASHHPRDKRGRFIVKGSGEAVAAAKEKIGQALKGGNVDASEIANHLGILTVKQLRDIHKEHGKKIPGRLRQDLVDSIKSRMGGGKKGPGPAPGPAGGGGGGPGGPPNLQPKPKPKPPEPKPKPKPEPKQKPAPAAKGEPIRGRPQSYREVQKFLLEDTHGQEKVARIQAIAKKHEALKQQEKTLRQDMDKAVREKNWMERSEDERQQITAMWGKADELKIAAKKARDEAWEEMKHADARPLEQHSFSVFDKATEKRVGKNARVGAQWLAERLGTRMNVTVRSNTTGRAFARRNEIHVDSKDDIATVVHEIGHTLEMQNPGLLQASLAFVRGRTAGESGGKLKDLIHKGYRDDEESLGRDAFDKAFGKVGPYVAKHYGGQATEVVSMGLEQMYRDPIKFAAADPEYFHFMTAVMEGRIG